jgi:ketosteroid isomerase-like protein
MSDNEPAPGPAARDGRIGEFFGYIDRWDFDALRRFFAEDVVVRLSNGDETRGFANFAARAAQSRANLAAIRHTILAIHHSGDGHVATVECDVDYTAPDGVTVKIPGAAILVLDADGLVTGYRVYSNTAMLALR